MADVSHGDPTVLDLERLATWLTTSGTSVNGRLSAERIGDGRSNLTFLLSDQAGSRWVARRPPLGNLLQSAHDVERECRILTSLMTSDVPVPEVVGLASAGVAADAPVLVMEHVEGVVLGGREAAKAISVPTRTRVGTELVRTLSRIHAVDLGVAGLDDLASHAPYAERQIRRWSRQLENTRTRDLPLLDRLTEILGKGIPPHRSTTLVHGDFNLSNVIVNPDDGSIETVLDWELCTLGDPLADMGSLLAYWRNDGEEASGPFATAALVGFPRRDELAALYLDLSGADPSDLDYWHVLGLWKLAVIGEGVLHRSRQDSRNVSLDFQAGAKQVDDLTRRAIEAATASGLDA